MCCSRGCRGFRDPAGGANPEDFEHMVVNLEVRVARKIFHEIVEGTGREGDGRAAAFAEQVMPVSRCAPDVGRVAIRLHDTGEDIDGGQYLECPVDRCPADTRPARGFTQLGDQLFGGEGTGMPENGIDNRRSRRGEPVAVLAQDPLDLFAGEQGGFGLVDVVIVPVHGLHDTTHRGTLSHYEDGGNPAKQGHQRIGRRVHLNVHTGDSEMRYLRHLAH